MEQIKKNLANLLLLKTIVTLAITFGLLYGFITGIIEPKDFMILTIMVYTFYFTKKNESDK